MLSAFLTRSGACLGTGVIAAGSIVTSIGGLAAIRGVTTIGSVAGVGLISTIGVVTRVLGHAAVLLVGNTGSTDADGALRAIVVGIAAHQAARFATKEQATARDDGGRTGDTPAVAACLLDRLTRFARSRAADGIGGCGREEAAHVGVTTQNGFASVASTTLDGCAARALAGLAPVDIGAGISITA